MGRRLSRMQNPGLCHPAWDKDYLECKNPSSAMTKTISHTANQLQIHYSLSLILIWLASEPGRAAHTSDFTPSGTWPGGGAAAGGWCTGRPRPAPPPPLKRRRRRMRRTRKGQALHLVQQGFRSSPSPAPAQPQPIPRDRQKPTKTVGFSIDWVLWPSKASIEFPIAVPERK